MEFESEQYRVFQVGNWLVDPDRLKIRRNDDPEIQLTPRAMGVLVILAGGNYLFYCRFRVDWLHLHESSGRTAYPRRADPFNHSL